MRLETNKYLGRNEIAVQHMVGVLAEELAYDLAAA